MDLDMPNVIIPSSGGMFRVMEPIIPHLHTVLPYNLNLLAILTIIAFI